MAFKNIPITIDTMIRNPVPIEGVNQEDNIELNITVTENKTVKNLSSQTIKAYVKRIDGTLVEQADNITITEPTQGKATIKLKNSAFNTEGYALFQLDISDSSGRITSSYATFKVGKGLISGEAIDNTNEVNALKQIEEYVEKANVDLKVFEQTVETINADETIRKENESKRVQAEAGRVQAEANRVQAETNRVQAEAERVEAESTREGRLKALETEIANARVATTGESFNNLDDRIDTEIERINKKIEFAFMEQTDAVSHSIENSVEGMTTDMCIKGRILQNLWDIKTSDGYYNVDLTNGYYVENNKNFPCEPDTKYTIIYNEKTPTNCYGSVLCKDINGLHISEGANCYNGKVTTFTTPSNCYYVYTRGFRSTAPHTIKGNGFNFIMVKGELKEAPAYFEGIKSFGEAEGNKISILSSGKNLANQSISKLWIDSDNVIRSAVNSMGIIFNNLKKNTNYTLSVSKGLFNRQRVGVGNDLKINSKVEVIKDDSLSTNSITINTGNYTGACFYVSTSGEVYDGVMFEEGLKATPYEPYKQDKKDILIKEPLRSIGDVSDELYEDNGQVKVNRNVKQYVFTGEENFVKQNTYGDVIRFDFACNDIKPMSYIISNNFIKGIIGTEDLECINVHASSKIIQFQIKANKLTSPDVQGFKAWLKANPTTVYYQLATPVTEVAENCVNIDLNTYKDKTYVNFENSLKGTSSFKAPINTLETISRLSNENNNLKKQNFALKQNIEENKQHSNQVDTDIIATNWDIDYRLCEIEWTIEGQRAKSEKINLFTIKGGISNMALSRYEQAKIMILGGAYNKEVLTRQLTVYLKRGYVSQEEYDELIALMEAREMVESDGKDS